MYMLQWPVGQLWPYSGSRLQQKYMRERLFQLDVLLWNCKALNFDECAQ